MVVFKRVVLIADPDSGIRRQLVRALGEWLAPEEMVDLQTCENVESALSLLRGARVDVAFIDQALLLHGGDQLANALSDVDVVVATRPSGSLDARDAPKFVRAFVERGVATLDRAIHAIREALLFGALKEHARSAELRAIRGEGAGEIVLASKAMRALVARARRVAPTESPVLILGEAGTGKELLGRLIYRVSQRGSLVSLECGELSPEDLDRDLEASATKKIDGPSAWERADGGTLLLLHAEALSRAAQSVVLERISSRTTRVRVIATADPSIREASKTDDYQRDLFLALGRPLLELPLLRQRKDDIPVLANHFLLQFIRIRPEASRELRIGVEAMRALRRASWPRNVAELEAAVTHAALVARTHTIVPGDLPDEDGAVRALRGSLGEEPYARARLRVIAEFEREYVSEVLERTEHNLAQAARESGMDRANFRRLVKRAQGSAKPARPASAKKAPVRGDKDLLSGRTKRAAKIRPDEPDDGES